MQTYTQQTKSSCGLDALVFASGKPVADVMKAWGISDIQKFGNLQDSPWSHFVAMEKLKVKFQLIGSSDICNSKGFPNQTVILIHNVPVDAEVRSIFTELSAFLHTNLEEHWIVLESVVANTIRFHAGDGSIKQMRHDQFKRIFDAGVVRCAYVVGRGNYRLSWFQRLWATITGKFC